MVEVKKNPSFISVFLSVLLAVLIMLSAGDWKKENKVINADVISYYAYLPATFIFHDLKLQNETTYKNGIFWPETLPGGEKVIKTTMGLSVLYSPFFLVSHLIAKISGGDAFGFSSIYKFGLLLSALFYFFVGLIFLRKILKLYFSENITAITIIAVAIGTNLLYYASYESTMSHVYNFALLNIFIWLTIKWHKSKSFKQLILIGFLAGLIALVRPSNIIILLFFFLYGIYNKDTFLQKTKYVFSHFHWFVLMGVAFLLVWVPQFLYWKYVTGDFLFYSYTNERFFFNHPHIIDGLFSYRKGWLLYTPIMSLALLGFYFLFKKQKELFLPIFAFTVLNIYIIFSWWCWWYGGSYGMRPLIDSYGLLAIPMAALFAGIQKNGQKVFLGTVFVATLLVAQNLFHVRKYRTNAIHWDSMTKAAFWHTYFNQHPRPGYWELLQQPDYDSARQGLPEKGADK